MLHTPRKRTHPHPRWLAALLLLVLLQPVGNRSAHAQPADATTFTMVLRDVPLATALEELVATTQINLAYDSKLVRGTRVFCSAREASVEGLLHCILDNTGLDFYQTSAGTYVLTASARQPSRYGRLAGVVVDRSTGEPLPYANVLLADAGVGTVTNKAGLFSFSPLVSGPHRVIATYVGYKTIVDSVWIPPGDSIRRRITLHARPVKTAPVVVNGLQQRLPSRGLGRGELTAEAMTNLGSVGTADVARGTSSLLGVGLQTPLADLHIQGGGAGEHQMQLDGVPIRNPVTLGRLLGAFSPLAIERLTTHKAGFGAQHGSLLAGIITAEHALGASGRQHITTQIDPLSFNGRIRGRWKGPSDLQATAMAAVRTSVWGLYRDPTLEHLLRSWHIIDPLLTPEQPAKRTRRSYSLTSAQHRADVDFSDVHGAARLRLNPFHSLYASIYRGHNTVDSRSIVKAPDTDRLMSQDRYHWTSWAGQLRHEWLLGARALSTLRLYGSRQSLGHGYQMANVDADDLPSGQRAGGNGPYDGNRVSEVALEANLDYSLATRHHLSSALKITRIASRALINDDFFRPLRYENADWHLSGYMQDELSLGLQTTIEAGTRLTYVASRQTVYAEPRMAVRYDGGHEVFGDYALRLAGGVYRQFTNRFDLSSTGPTAIVPSIRFWLPVDRSLAPPRSYHLAADVLLKPNAHWKVNLEGYYKWQPRLLAINYPALLETDAGGSPSMTQAGFLASSRGRAVGGGLRVRHTGSWGQGTLSYSYSRARRRFPARFGERMEPTPWNQPHRLLLESRLSLTAGLAARLHWRGIWGRSWALRRAYYDYLAPQSAPEDYAPFDLSAPSHHTLPPLYRLDVGLSYAHSWGSFSMKIRADLINVLDRRNEFDWHLRPTGERYERVARTMPGRHPVFSLRLGY